MNKKLLLVLFSFLSIGINAQSYRGYHTDNYSGVHGMLSNPALINSNKLKYDINILSADLLLSNSYLGIDFSDLESFDATNSKEQSANLIFDGQILGPSFFFKLNKKSAFGIFTKARFMTNVADINSDLLNVFTNGVGDLNDDIPRLDEDGFGIAQNTWAEAGITYARDLWVNDKHAVKGGFSAKYLFGGTSSFINSQNLSFEYTNSIIPGAGIVNMGGTVNYATQTDLFGDNALDNIINSLGESSGFGGDIGFTYELKDTKTTEDDYKFRFGASVLDIGAIDYKLNEKTYILEENVNLTEAQFEELGDKSFDDFVNDNYTTLTNPNPVSPNIERKVRVTLPTQLQLNADFKFTRKIYINATSSISLTNSINKRETKSLTHHTVTPRYESKLFSLWSPVGIDEFDNLTWGAGFRFGPVFAGSGSALSSLLGDTKIADVYFGVKFPIIQRIDKDSDGDGVMNRDDSCKRTPGPSENFGCPLNEVEEIEEVEVEEVENTDLDQDGVLNDVDECPNTKGTVANKGCPVSIIETIIGKPDTIVISTPIKQIEKKIDGDTDMDGVMDSMDDCPTVFGTKENKGCPVTIKELEVFRQDVREVYFDTGSSDVNLNSAARLKSAAVVMKKFPDMYWIVEGHSDSQGNEVYNQKLSEDRAKEVKNFFITNGIEAGKIDSYGYGESRPQTTNATAAGRAKNRRVEMRAADAQGKLVGLDLPKEDVVNEMSNLVKFVYFETGSDVIIDNSKSQLELIAYYMKKHAGKYEIQGHTDDVGSQETNMLLSEKRAKAVVKYLINEGVSAESLKAVGYGELSPVADNSTKDGQAENRRIEIKLSN